MDAEAQRKKDAAELGRKKSHAKICVEELARQVAALREPPLHLQNPADHVALVFIDLDNGTSTSLQYAYSDGVWSKSQITALPCPDSDEGGLIPRDSGYTVGQTAGPAGDRLLILGGSPGETDENNVYYSVSRPLQAAAAAPPSSHTHTHATLPRPLARTRARRTTAA